MRAPYVKMYRDESGSFGQLPLMTRSLARELMVLADDAGVIHLGRRAPHEAVIFGLGAERSERRSVRAHIELLLSDGYLVHDTERRLLIIPSFPRVDWSPARPPQTTRGAAPKPQQTTNGAATDRHGNGADAPTERHGNGADDPTERQHAPKSPESHGGTEPALKDQSREEENRKEVEVERASAPTTRPRKRFDVMAYHALHPVVLAAREAWQAEYSRAFGKPYVARGHGDALAVARLAHWCELHAESTPGAIATEVASRVVRHFVAAKHAAGGTPPAQTWLDPDGVNYPLDPAAYLDPHVARPVRRGGRGAPTGMLPVSTDFGPAPEESDIPNLFA